MNNLSCKLHIFFNSPFLSALCFQKGNSTDKEYNKYFVDLHTKYNIYMHIIIKKIKYLKDKFSYFGNKL